MFYGDECTAVAARAAVMRWHQQHQEELQQQQQQQHQHGCQQQELLSKHFNCYDDWNSKSETSYLSFKWEKGCSLPTHGSSFLTSLRQQQKTYHARRQE